MKSFFQKRVTLIVLSILCVATTPIFAQVQRTCGTMKAIEDRLATDSVYRADYEAKRNNLASYLAAHPNIENFASGDTITIPVVVHIVLANPNIVTDANVDYFINRLNIDFSGRNPDSTKASTHYGVRGRSLIRFALARRDINGNATTGVERKVGSVTIAQTTYQAIKTAAAGLVPWDITKYYNLWVGDVGSTGLLGISPQIGPGTQAGSDIDGICCNYQAFANNACFSISNYALARTSVHEIGHNFGLNHTFQGACASSDFSDNLSSPGMAFPAALLTGDDTPPTSAPTYTCPTTQTAANGCTPSVPKQYQNYMDYADDVCMVMFTKHQVDRMHYVIEKFRPGYLTTKGHLPPDGTPINEAGALDIVSPGGTDATGCTPVSYPTPVCTGTNGAFVPKLRVASYGVNNLTSITVNLELNGTLISQTFSTNLGPGKSAVFTLPSQTLAQGSNVLKYYTSNPNGVIDSIASNDTIKKVILFNSQTPAAAALAIVEDFEAPDFNPTISNWDVVTTNTGTNTWKRTTTAAKTGSACAKIQMFGNAATGDVNSLRSQYLNFNNATDTPYLAFHYAYRLKGSVATARKDTLAIEVSTDCAAANWTAVWKKGGTQLPTNATIIATDWTAAAGDWTTNPIKVNLWAYRNTPCYIRFKATNGNGQNLFLDDINITSAARLPLKLTMFNVQQNTNNVVCKWETTQEDNVKNFNVERSLNGRTFESIGTVAALGNTTNTAFYQFKDDNANKLTSSTIYYRLKINDVNGKYNYSNVVFVKLGEKQSLQVYPNPAKDVVNVQITNSSSSVLNNTVQLVDYLGRVLLEKKVAVATGTQAVELNTTNLAKGNYVIVVKANSEVKTLKFIKE
jgi:Secretion system C-terminal sorting domain/Pregnancy-associated plasma protein-A